jgi:hypothetical protein
MTDCPGAAAAAGVAAALAATGRGGDGEAEAAASAEAALAACAAARLLSAIDFSTPSPVCTMIVVVPLRKGPRPSTRSVLVILFVFRERNNRHPLDEGTVELVDMLDLAVAEDFAGASADELVDADVGASLAVEVDRARPCSRPPV